MTDFLAPQTVEEAMQRKRILADHVTQTQTALSQRSFADAGGRVLRGRDRTDHRDQLKQKLDILYAEMRFLKDWLRANASHKPSEWNMLGRAYRLLCALEDKGVTLGKDGEVLLSEIELHVPHAHLYEQGLQTA